MKQKVSKNKSQRWFFEKKNSRPLVQLTKRGLKEKKIQVNRIRNEQGNIAADSKETQNIIRKSFKNLYFIQLKI